MTGFIVVLIVGLLLIDYAVDSIVEIANIRHIRSELPGEFQGFYDQEKYARSQRYLRDTTVFGLVSSGAVLIMTIMVIASGGFSALDGFIRSFGRGEILNGLLFCGALLTGYQILRLPFSLYHTFVIEERYGFNKTSLSTFFLDLCKGLVLTALLGGGLLAGVLWFFGRFGTDAWVYCWGGFVAFELLLTFVAPVLIMPLFNKFTPLPEGELRQAIESYAGAQMFKLQGIFTMDGSRRSAKANAFFTGFGAFKRIVLFDTLVARQTVQELLAVLAHEMGHFKRGHIRNMLMVSIGTSGIMFYLLSIVLGNPLLFQAFRMEQVSVYASLVFFGLLVTPLSSLLSIAGNVLSRRYEYDADAYAARTLGTGDDLIAALKKLTVDNLGNLTPHPWKVFLAYSHPPVLDRIAALRRHGERPAGIYKPK